MGIEALSHFQLCRCHVGDQPCLSTSTDTHSRVLMVKGTAGQRFPTGVDSQPLFSCPKAPKFRLTSHTAGFPCPLCQMPKSVPLSPPSLTPVFPDGCGPDAVDPHILVNKIEQTPSPLGAPIWVKERNNKQDNVVKDGR